MSDQDLHALSEHDQGRLAGVLMRRQGTLSLRVAAVFVALVVGVLIYPITVALSFYFVGASNKIETECLDWRKALAEEDDR